MLLLLQLNCVVSGGEHPDEGGGGRAVSALTGETQERGPDEGTAAGEGGAHVQGHQSKVQKLGDGEREGEVGGGGGEGEGERGGEREGDRWISKYG